MYKREFIKPRSGKICVLFFDPSHRNLCIDHPNSSKGREFLNHSGTKKDFYDHVEKLEKQGWKETPASLSRRMLVQKEGGKVKKFWCVELNGDSLEINYGTAPSWGWWPTIGTFKSTDLESEELARYEYATRVKKKLKEGYNDYEPRKTEYAELVVNPPPKPKKAKAKAAAGRPAGTSRAAVEPDLDNGPLRFEYSDGKSDKFWEIELAGDSHTVAYGRQGTTGQSKTKSFPDAGKARASAEKLIAEKTKKGYQFVSTAGVSPSATDKPAAKPAAKQAAKPEAAETADPEIVLEVTSEIDLRPRDWRRAAFSKLKPLKITSGKPFDLAECKRRLTSLKRVRYAYPFHDLNLEPDMSAEEAHFWWLVTSRGSHHYNVRDLLKGLPIKQITGQLTVKEAHQVLKKEVCMEEAAGPLYRLLGHDGFFELMQLDLTSKSRYGPDSDAGTVLAKGFLKYCAAYASSEQKQAIRKRVKQDWAKVQWPTGQQYVPLPCEAYLAAAAGMPDELLQLVSELKEGCFGAQDLVLALASPDLVASEWRRLKLPMRDTDDVRAFLACTELAALEVVVEQICQQGNAAEAQDLMATLTLVRAPEAAESMLACVQQSKAASMARGWLDKNLGNAIAGLAKTAAGRGKLAEGAVQFLREAKKAGHGKLIEQCAQGLAPDAARKLTREVIDFKEKEYQPFDAKSTPKWLRDALQQAQGVKGKKAPEWAAADQLPPLAVGDQCLNGEQLEIVLAVLQDTILPDRHALLKALQEHADASQRDAFAWRLFERWLEEGAPSKQKWAMCALGHLGAEQCALKLTPMVRVWPGESQHQRAVVGLECLRAMGSDTALMQLNGIAQKLKFQGLKKKAREFMEQVASLRGMTRSELEDLIVPDLDLDERGSRTFDFGSRTFQFVLKPDLKPGVRDEDGKLRNDPPKPSSKDDADKANLAIEQWKLLKKQLREAIKIQTPRLEQAMVTGRKWRVDQFESLLVRHPLMVNFVRMLLWGGYNDAGELGGTFRVTEEQDYADSRDEPCNLSKHQQIGVVHPLHLSQQEAAAWGEVFSDYEIVSPFPQIGRPIYGLEKGEDKKKELTRFGNVKIPPTSLVGTLDRLGWVRGVPEDGGVFHEHSKPFYGADVTAVVGYEDGVPIGYMEGWDDQRITECFFVPGIYTPQMYPRHKKALQLGKVEPVVLSEVIADMHVLVSKGS